MSKKRRLLHVLSLTFLSITSYSQVQLDVEGALRISSMSVENNADSVVVRLSDGILAMREASTLMEHQILSISNDTIYLTNGGFVVLPARKILTDADMDTKVSVEKDSTDSDQIQFVVRDKNILVIDSTGKIGINDTLPSELLSIRGGNLLQVPDSNFLVGKISIGSGAAEAIAISDKYAYLVDRSSDSLIIVNVHNPRNPELVGCVDLGGSPYDIKVVGDYAYVVDNSSDDLKIIDVSNPNSPAIVGSLFLNANVLSVDVSGRYAYAAGAGILKIIDITNPDQPSLISSTFNGSPWHLKVLGQFLYCINRVSGGNNFTIVDVSNPYIPVTKGSIDVGDIPSSIFVTKSYAYVITAGSNSFIAVDITDADQPVIVDSLDIGDSPTELFVSGRYAYIVDNVSDDLKIVDISDPTNMFLVGSKGFGNTSSEALFVAGRYAYVTLFSPNELRVYDISGIDIPSINANSLEAGSMHIRNDITLSGSLDAKTSISAGAGGIISKGGLSTVGTVGIANGVIPSSSPNGMIQLYSEDVAGSSELKVRDEAGNVTTLSPHNFSLIGKKSEEMAWSYFSENQNIKINVDMLKVVRLVEKLSGEKLVYIEDKSFESDNSSKVQGSVKSDYWKAKDHTAFPAGYREIVNENVALREKLDVHERLLEKLLLFLDLDKAVLDTQFHND